MLCYEFLVGKPPFETNNTHDTYRKIVNVDFKFPSHVSPGAKDLIIKVSENNYFSVGGSAMITKLYPIVNLCAISVVCYCTPLLPFLPLYIVTEKGAIRPPFAR